MSKENKFKGVIRERKCNGKSHKAEMGNNKENRKKQRFCVNQIKTGGLKIETKRKEEKKVTKK